MAARGQFGSGLPLSLTSNFDTPCALPYPVVTMVPTPPVSIAPMIEKTDRHFRYFMRRITRSALLYTEMITAAAIIHGDRDRLLSFDDSEHPISLQLGGDDPGDIHRATTIAAEYGYDEYNLNVGCPSDRVQTGHFGACLMATPDRVAQIVEAMRAATDRPATVKSRIGIDGRETYEHLCEFVETVSAAQPDRFTVHARIAILNGLSPKQNRTIPPLRYSDVYRLKREHEHLQVEINGGITSLDQVSEHLTHVDGVMVGRAAYDEPWMFRTVDSRFFGAEPRVLTRRDVVEEMYDYIAAVQQARPPRDILRHMLGLFAGQPGTRRYKQVLSGPTSPATDGVALLKDAVAKIDAEILDS